MEANGMMARQFESGFYLVERCRRELPALAACFRSESAMRAALDDLVEAAQKVESLLRLANEHGEVQRRGVR
jgi:hypothetical protein